MWSGRHTTGCNGRQETTSLCSYGAGLEPPTSHISYRDLLEKVSHKEADIAVAKAFKVLVITINILTLAHPFKLTGNLIELNAKV